MTAIDLLHWADNQPLRNQAPVQALWEDVLMFAVRDAIVDPGSSVRLRTIRDQARKWLFSDSDAGTPCSVLWVCRSLGIEALDRIRRFVDEGTPDQFARVRAKVFKSRGRDHKAWSEVSDEY